MTTPGAILGSAVVLPWIALCAEVPDGLYYGYGGKSDPAVKTVDGQEARLWKRFDVEVLGAEMVSRDNGNTRFDLSVAFVPPPRYVDRLSKVLVVKGVAYRQSGGLGGDPSKRWMDFNVAGADRAKEVADYFGIQPVCRRHPGHKLFPSFVPDREEFQVGERVGVTMSIENVGDVAVAFTVWPGNSPRALDSQFRFSAQRDGKPVKVLACHVAIIDILTSLVNLNPGAVHKVKANLWEWFSFDEPGVYDVVGSYRIELHEPGAAPPWRCIWDEHVSAQFTVKVVPRKPASESPPGADPR